MEEIFIIFGKYDDWECCRFPITFRLTEGDAKKEVERLIEIQNKVSEAEKLIFEHYKKVSDELGEVVCGEYKQRKKWPSGIGENDITKEMRDERNSNDEYNCRIELDYTERLQAQETKCRNEAEKHSKTLGLDEEVRKTAFEMKLDKYLYSYEKLEKK